MKFFKMKIVFLLTLLMFGTKNLIAQEQFQYLELLIHEAITKSPEIKEYKAKLGATASRIQIGTNLPDPTLTLGAMNLPTNSFSFEQEPMTGKIVGLSQGIPFPGSLGAKESVKSVDTSIVLQEIEDLKNQIQNEVSTKYFDLQLVREEIRLAKESEQLLKQISEVVKSNYEVSASSLQNVIQVEVQITRIKDKLETLSGKEIGIIAEINALLLRDGSEPIQTFDSQEIRDMKLSGPSLLSSSKENRPLLKGIKLAIDKAYLMEKSAEYEFYPNFKFGVQYTQRDKIGNSGVNLNDFLSVVVGISLPINYGGKKTSKISEAKFLQSQFLEKYNVSIQLLERKFGKITAKLDELIEREKLIVKSLLPQAKQLLRASLADYQVAKIDFVNVIKAENDILNIQTNLASIRAEYYKSLAELEFLSGEKIINKNTK